MFHPTLGASAFTLFWKMGCNRRTAHEHIISCLKLSLAKQAKQTLPERLMQHLLTGKLALDVVQQCWLQTARLHYFIDLSGSRRHIGWQVPILRSQRSCWVKDVMGCAQLSKRVNHPCSNVQCYFFPRFLHLQHLEPWPSVCKDELLSFWDGHRHKCSCTLCL